MKLTPAQIERTVKQFSAQPVSEDGQLAPKLYQVFGEHTFFLTDDGLHIVQPVEESGSGSTEARVVKLARWKDPERTTLAPHDPEVSATVVALDQAA